MTNYLEVKNLSKSFDSFQLHNISFTLPKGYIMGLIGPNGSGKTTTIKLILNTVSYTHLDVYKRQVIGYFPPDQDPHCQSENAQ